MPRKGKGSKSYPNRTDIPAKAASSNGPGRTYGDRKADMDAQAAVPVAPPPGDAPVPGALGPLSGPSRRPGEPVTAGIPLGPGPGPESLTTLGDNYGRPSPSAFEHLVATTDDPFLRSLLARVRNT